MSRINISIINPDKMLSRTLDKIDDKQLVGGAFRTIVEGKTDPVIAGVLDIVRHAAHPCQLDLIGHARDGELHLSRWLISANEDESTSLRRQLKDGAIDEVRLLGCLTAATAQGRAAMEHLKAVLGVPRVYGTTNLIGARDFGAEGFTSVELLAEAGTEVPLPSVADAWSRLDSVAELAQIEEVTLRSETREEADANALTYQAPSPWDIKPMDNGHQPTTSGGSAPQAAPWAIDPVDNGRQSLADLLASCCPDVRIAPGLLLLPDREYLYPVPSPDGARTFRRVTSLLDGQLLRVYPRSDTRYPEGVLLRPAQPFKL